MKKSKKLSGFSAIFWAVIFSVLLLSCEKKDTSSNNAPKLPPEDAFVMNFDDFNNKSKSLNMQNAISQTETMINRNFAALNVGLWNTLITSGLSIPVLSYREALRHKAVNTGIGQWEWTYSFVAANANHSAKLQARINNENIIWKMYITKDGGYSDFLWYEGVSKITGQDGMWILYNNPAEAKKLLGIEWERNSISGTSNIKYTNILPEGSENGGYIAYGIVSGIPDAYYDIYNKGKDQHTNIKWDRSTKEGRVKAPYFFKSDNWKCWDNTLADIQCSK